jgi:hypothetical protein
VNLFLLELLRRRVGETIVVRRSHGLEEMEPGVEPPPFDRFRNRLKVMAGSRSGDLPDRADRADRDLHRPGG